MVIVDFDNMVMANFSLLLLLVVLDVMVMVLVVVDQCSVFSDVPSSD